MASKTDVCNIALTGIGAKTITSIDDAVKSAIVCKRRFDDVRDAVLRSYPWKCALVRVALPVEASAPLFSWSNQYILPGDCLRVVSLKESDYEWKREGTRILTDVGPPLNVLYISRLENTSEWDALLVQAVGAYLGSEVAEALTQSNEKRRIMYELYKQKLEEARFIDSQEGSNLELEADDWLKVRY